ncbi:hypothetical protein D3C73_1023090 [compost metagenome]
MVSGYTVLVLGAASCVLAGALFAGAADSDGSFAFFVPDEQAASITAITKTASSGTYLLNDFFIAQVPFSVCTFVYPV